MCCTSECAALRAEPCGVATQPNGSFFGEQGLRVYIFQW
jgi:hypothetical protein